MPSEGRPSQPTPGTEGGAQPSEDISVPAGLAKEQPPPSGEVNVQAPVVERPSRGAPPPLPRRPLPRPPGAAAGIPPPPASSTPSRVPPLPRPSNDVVPRVGETLRPIPTPTAGSRAPIVP